MGAQSPGEGSPSLVVEAVPVLAATLMSVLAEEARAAVAARGRFVLAVPGGSVAAAFFPDLGHAPVDWRRVEVFWTDERAVPPDDPDSNFGVARRLWLDRAGVPALRVHRMRGEAADLEAAAAEYEAELGRALGPSSAPDAVLLGMGADGHVASLFPGHAALDERVRRVLAVTDSPKPPPRRLTLTVPVLASAEAVVVVALGAAKADALRAVVDDPASRLPAALTLRAARRAWVFADPAAARRLPRPPGQASKST